MDDGYESRKRGLSSEQAIDEALNRQEQGRVSALMKSTRKYASEGRGAGFSSSFPGNSSVLDSRPRFESGI